MITASAIEEKLRSIVGVRHFRAATASDTILGVEPKFVAEPASERELAALLSSANEAQIAVIPRGGGTKLAWGNPPKRADLVLSTARLNRVLEHAWADLTVSVEAGCTLLTLEEKLAQHGQRLALDGLQPESATIGGILSTNDSGVLRLRFGALRDLVIGVTLALADGTLASSGGKVVKNVAGYDLPKLATGALGTLGVITRAIFRLHALPWATKTVTCSTDRISQAQQWITQLLASNLSYSAAQTRFVARRKPEIFVDILFEGTEAGIASQIAQVKSLARPISVADADHSVWQFRQRLHAEAKQNPAISTIGKISALPLEVFGAMEDLYGRLHPKANFDAAIQATGLGVILLRGDTDTVTSALRACRKT